MYAGCAGKTVRSLSALEVWSRQGAIQILVYIYLYLLTYYYYYYTTTTAATATAAVAAVDATQVQIQVTLSQNSCKARHVTKVTLKLLYSWPWEITYGQQVERQISVSRLTDGKR